MSRLEPQQAIFLVILGMLAIGVLMVIGPLFIEAGRNILSDLLASRRRSRRP